MQQAFLRSLDMAGVVIPERTGAGAAATPAASSPSPPGSGELFDQGYTLAAVLRILALEDELAAERALTARLYARLADQDPAEP